MIISIISYFDGATGANILAALLARHASSSDGRAGQQRGRQHRRRLRLDPVPFRVQHPHVVRHPGKTGG